MFKKNQRKILELENKIEKLEANLVAQKDVFEQQLKTLRQQLAAVVSGVPPTTQSILNALPYSEIPKEQVLEFIQTVPNLLILDVRSDEGWSSGHIAKAKHIPAVQVSQRLNEFPDKTRPILTICANGNSAVTICQLLVREGYTQVFNALGGMAGYRGPMIKPEILASDAEQVKGSDRKLITKLLSVLDNEVRPGLKRDGGDLQIIEVENGVVKLKMTGACVGCGAQKRTVEEGIKNHLKKYFPEILHIEDLSLK